MKLTVTILALALGSFSCAGYGYGGYGGYGHGYGHGYDLMSHGAHDEAHLHNTEVSELHHNAVVAAEAHELSHELEVLRERVHYGRRFRLLGHAPSSASANLR